MHMHIFCNKLRFYYIKQPVQFDELNIHEAQFMLQTLNIIHKWYFGKYHYC